jgi:enoyl-CoA hydratase
MTYRLLELVLENNIATLRIPPGGPDGSNQLQLQREIESACANVNDDPAVHVLLIFLEGDIPLDEQCVASIDAIGQPVVCAISDDAGSSSLSLALRCDVRIAAEDARFSLESEVPAARLARLVGRGEALRLLLLGESIDAQDALRIGLVSAVHSAASVHSEASALAARLASRGPIALRYAKEAVRRGLDLPLDEALRMETDLTVILQTTEDRAEGVRAFIEKREPEFKGR